MTDARAKNPIYIYRVLCAGIGGVSHLKDNAQSGMRGISEYITWRAQQDKKHF